MHRVRQLHSDWSLKSLAVNQMLSFFVPWSLQFSKQPHGSRCWRRRSGHMFPITPKHFVTLDCKMISQGHLSSICYPPTGGAAWRQLWTCAFFHWVAPPPYHHHGHRIFSSFFTVVHIELFDLIGLWFHPCSDSQLQSQDVAITEEDLQQIQERESAIRQLEVRLSTHSGSAYSDKHTSNQSVCVAALSSRTSWTSTTSLKTLGWWSTSRETW